MLTSSSGGLGHFAIMWANALGAEVTAISHSANKKSDALKLGAKHFVLNSDEKWAEPLAFKFDFVLNCADMTHEFDIPTYLSILKVNKTFHQVGLPDHPLPQFQAQAFMSNGSSIGASHIGNRPEMLAMLKLVSEKELHPMIETLDMSEKGVSEGVQKVKENKVRYRATLINFDKAFPNR